MSHIHLVGIAIFVGLVVLGLAVIVVCALAASKMEPPRR